VTRSSPDDDALVRRFDAPDVHAIVLTGSYARGDAGPWSDVDLLRFVSDDAADLVGSGSHLIDGRLVVVSNVVPAHIASWFEQPDQAVIYIPGVRTARALVDRDGAFAAVQERARAFVWDAAMQARADAWASEELVGWMEEAHKGLEGLRRDDVGRLLSARHGLSWGLQRVVQVQRGVLLTSGDNSFWSEVAAAVGVDSEWVRLREMAFGAVPMPLHAQVIAGLRLYVLTATMLQNAIQPHHASLITTTANRISTTLSDLVPDGGDVI
jgi:hypothetical protein